MIRVDFDNRRHYTKAEIKEMKLLAAKGFTVAEIAKSLGRTKTGIEHKLRRLCIKTKPAYRTKPHWLKMSRSELSTLSVAEVLDCIEEARKHFGVEIISKKRR